MLLMISFLFPEFLADDRNSFLQDFLDNDLLSVLGFITALSNASILSIFLHLNYLEDAVQFAATNARRTLRLSGLSLIVVFLLAFAVLIVKPIVPDWARLNAVLNSLGILCVVFSLSVLRDILITVTVLPTKRAIRKAQAENRKKQGTP
jgi:hypothetical protein